MPYVRRLIEDEYVQEQLRNSHGAGLRAAYERARDERAHATEDKRLYGHVREVPTSVRKAVVALQGPKPKRRLRKVTILALAVRGDRDAHAQAAEDSRGRHPPPRASVAGDRMSVPGAEPEHAAPGTPHSAA